MRDVNAEKKKKQIEWAKRMTIDQVTFTADGDNVESLGSRKWMELSVNVTKAFMKQNNITSAQNLRSKGDLGICGKRYGLGSFGYFFFYVYR